MNYYDIDRPGPEYLPYSTQTIETWECRRIAAGFYGAKTSKIYSRLETGGVSWHKVEGGGNGCVGLETAADLFGYALTNAHV